MSANGRHVVGRVGDVVTTVGVEHVRLSYEYLDRRDMDGYGSLFDDEAELCSPVAGVVRGRAGIESYQAERAVDGGRHVVEEVIAAPGRVVVVGRVTGAGREVEFVDLFTLTEHGLLRSQKSFFFAAPR
ncbi:nuclear transport factor 2 family protein [Saccharothrix texasensis]|uniref:SnoaL-like protein n=1 Tax=Saccharothrix texasensis TaxID=103734 RepID=A0A3N1H073_9PSEU|nr:nuclear transport factor 2 family protein [Saccharothrix texasensis]ROP35953.1 SnoaL-like protein [Saccharothrix texasensis]